VHLPATRRGVFKRTLRKVGSGQTVSDPVQQKLTGCRLAVASGSQVYSNGKAVANKEDDGQVKLPVDKPFHFLWDI